MLKTLVRSVIAIGVAFFAGRQAIFAGRDLARYNTMREMSDDSALRNAKTGKGPTNAAATSTNPFAMLTSIPSDLARYIKLKSM